ncbi:MAG: transposon-transfer assisting family protein [Roseburia sp.]|nr:transposon-transfer assisting family protein [Roseburia sp.]MCM1278320.1 transposon-transfer assisting family protein [Robinsoniella sp.]
MGQFIFEEINLIYCYRRKTRTDTVAAMTAAIALHGNSCSGALYRI